MSSSSSSKPELLSSSKPELLSLAKPKRTVRCKYCDKKFHNRSGLSSHMLWRHPKGAFSKKHSAGNSLAKKNSVGKANKENTFCFDCKKNYSTKWNLQQHRDTVHSGIRYKRQSE
jgi:hypothetical protein